MEKIILTSFTLDELADKIVEKLSLNILGTPKQPETKKEEKEYLSVHEASELIHLAIPTIYGLTHIERSLF